MKIGLIVTIVYVAVSYGGEYIVGHSDALVSVGVSTSAQELISGALGQIGRGIATIALTLGLALPALRGESVVKKTEPE